MIRFEADSHQVTHAGEHIQLLPKEFLLLRFLYEHAGRSFTREQLLDAVWPLEAPVDRTVDDHVYRLRKKLSKWSHLLRMETIRGQGYKLTRLDPPTLDHPLHRDEQFAAHVNQMLAMYHGLGMGGAMRLLSANRDILGLPGDPFYDAYICFVSGEFDRLIGMDSIDIWQKAAYAAFVHAIIQFDHRTSLAYFEQLMARSDRLSHAWGLDLRLQSISLYIRTGLPEKAREQLEAIRAAIASLDSPSFAAIFLLNEMYLELHDGRIDRITANLQECEALLARHPIQRERGALLVFKAIFLYQQGAIESARQLLDDGIETIRQTQFVPHLLGSFNLALTHLAAGRTDEPYRQKLRREWDRLASEYRFDEMRIRIERLLNGLL